PVSVNASLPSYGASTTATYSVAASGGGGGAAGSFSDAFSRADSTNLDNGWSEVRGNLAIQGGRVTSGLSRVLHTAVLPGLTGATQHASAQFASRNNNDAPRFGVILRYQSLTSYYSCFRQVGGSSVLRIARVVNGVETILKSVAVPNPQMGAWFTLGCRVQGSTITLEFNG